MHRNLRPPEIPIHQQHAHGVKCELLLFFFNSKASLFFFVAVNY